MAAANIVITDAALTPNPVYAGEEYLISVKIEDVVYVLGDEEAVLADDDGALLEAPDATILALSDDDGAIITDIDDSIITILEE